MSQLGSMDKRYGLFDFAVQAVIPTIGVLFGTDLLISAVQSDNPYLDVHDPESLTGLSDRETIVIASSVAAGTSLVALLGFFIRYVRAKRDRIESEELDGLRDTFK